MDMNTSWLWWTTLPDMPKLIRQGTSQIKQLPTCFTMTLFYTLGFHQRSTMTRVVSLKMNSSIVSKNNPMSFTHEQHPTTKKVTGKLKDSTEPFYQYFAPYQEPTSLISKTICPSAYNCTRHEATCFSSFALLFGRSPHLPIDLLFGIGMKQPSKNYPSYVTQWRNAMQEPCRIAASNSSKSASQAKVQRDKKAHSITLPPGDRVLVKNFEKGRPGKIRAYWEQTVY